MDGTDIGVLFGIHSWLDKLIDQEQPDALVWVEDGGDSGRKAMDPGYKGARVRMEEPERTAFQNSINHVQELLASWNIPRLQVVGFEADDTMGTMALRVAAKGWTAVCVGHDKDMVQIVDERIHILMPGRGGAKPIPDTWLTPETAISRLGVPPHQVVDYLALTGDGSDSVTGVKGVGEKGAISLLATWGTLEAILENAAIVEPARYRKPLLEHGSSALLAKRLVTLQTNVPIPEGQDLRVKTRDGAAYDAVCAKFSLRARPEPAWITDKTQRRRPVSASAAPSVSANGSLRRAAQLEAPQGALEAPQSPPLVQTSVVASVVEESISTSVQTPEVLPAFLTASAGKHAIAENETSKNVEAHAIVAAASVTEADTIEMVPVPLPDSGRGGEMVESPRPTAATNDPIEEIYETPNAVGTPMETKHPASVVTQESDEPGKTLETAGSSQEAVLEVHGGSEAASQAEGHAGIDTVSQTEDHAKGGERLDDTKTAKPASQYGEQLTLDFFSDEPLIPVKPKRAARTR